MEKQIEIPAWMVIGFTGHRDLDDEEVIKRSIKKEIEQLVADYRNVTTLSSAASGADTLFLEVASAAGLPLQLILPFPMDRFSKDFSPDEWERVKPHIEQAYKTDVVVNAGADDEAYLDGGILTVDQCDLLIAVWNGEPAAGKGGTENIVRYARAKHKPLLIIDDKSGQSLWENKEGLLAPEKLFKYTFDKTPFSAHLENTLSKVDSIATATAPRARNLAMTVIALHLLATVITITNLLLHNLPPWATDAAVATEVLVLTLALGLVFRLHSLHHRWTDYRVMAETLRFFTGIWPLKRPSVSLASLAIRGQERFGRDIEITWRLREVEQVPSLEAGKAHYLKRRVQDQISHFDKKHSEAKRKLAIVKWTSIASTGVAIFAGLCALGLSYYQHQYGVHYVLPYYLGKWLIAVLPLLTAALVSYALTQDVHRRVTAYEEMKQFLKKMETQIKSAVTWEGLWRTIFETERQLISEVQEWHTVASIAAKAH